MCHQDVRRGRAAFVTVRGLQRHWGWPLCHRVRPSTDRFRWLTVGPKDQPDLSSQGALRDLDQVATRVVEHRRSDRPHLGRFLCESDTQVPHSRELLLNVLYCE